MSRTVSWFSCGAASAVATKLTNPDVVAYCHTGSEDIDNARFMSDCESWFGQEILTLKSEKYEDTWDVWQQRRYLSGISGAPCTSELKIAPRLKFQRDDDVHIFGYTADSSDVKRAESLREHWPELSVNYPLIEAGLTKKACLSLIDSAGIKPPRVYAMGFPNANCIPCCKASSPAYWSLVRQQFPDKFWRYAAQEAIIGAKTIQYKGERIQLRDLPDDVETTQPISPECDFLCAIAEQEMA